MGDSNRRKQSISERKRSPQGWQRNGESPIKWWTADDDDEAGAMLWSWIRKIRARLATSVWMDLAYESFYTGRPMGFDNSFQIAFLRSGNPASAHFNVIMSIVDTATARLTKRRPMPVISTDNARYTEQRFAKAMSRVLRNKVGGPNVEVISPILIRDMIINGNGFAQVCRHHGDVHVERVPIFELVYDPRSSHQGWPRQLGRCRPVDRDHLAMRWPTHADAIMRAPAFHNQYPWLVYAYDVPLFQDQVELAEAWHLPSTDEADDGVHVIAVDGTVLLREPWRRRRFPLSKCHWSNPLRGMRGQGLVEGLAGLQFKLNDVMRDIQEAAYHAGQLKVFMQRGSVNKHQLRARHPAVIEYDGQPPAYVPGSPISAGNIQLAELIEQKMYSLSGLNQMTSASQNPLGANASGAALETIDDVQSDRFAHVESGYQQFRVALGQCILDEAKAIYDELFSGEICGGRNEEAELTKKTVASWIVDHDWDKVTIDGGNYHLKLEPENYLHGSRGGKLAQVKDLAQSGYIADPTMAAELFDEPDIAAMNRPLLGAIHNIHRIVEGLCDPKKPMVDLMPTKTMNVPLGVLIVQGELEEATALEEDEVILERFRTWLEAAQPFVAPTNMTSLTGAQSNSIVNQANASTMGPSVAAPMVAPPGMPGMPPGGQGMPS